MPVATYTKSGAKAAAPTKLSKAVFGVEVKNHQLLKDAYLAYLANGRANLAVAKKRGEVRGGGKKPWRQKGTGRARFGSSRNPIWRGGGAAFGPTGSENYRRELNVSAKRQAIRQALSLAAAEDRIKVIESFDCPDGKVKPTLTLLSKVGAEDGTLIVVSKKDHLVERATRNLSGVMAVQADRLNTYDIMNANSLLISKKSLEMLDSWLGDAPKVEPSTKETANV